MRAFGRDLIRGGHYGQRSCEPRQKAEHMAAPTNPAKREESSCQSGANGMDPALAAVESRASTVVKEDVMQVVRIGPDLAKYVFEVHGVDNQGKVVVRKSR